MAGPPELWRYGASPAGRGHRGDRGSWLRGSTPVPGASWWTSCGMTRRRPTELLGRTARSSTARTGFVASTIWWACPRQCRGRARPQPSSTLSCPSRRTSRRRSSCAERTGPLLRHRAGPVAAAREPCPAAAGPLPPCHPGPWWRTRPIPAIIFSCSPSQELGSEVRRHIWSPVMVEGWALYSEQLMGEIGLLRTDEARLFQLVNLLWRAVRVVLDVGLHTRGMTPGRGGGLYGGAPADRAHQRRGRGPPLLCLADLPAVLCGRPAGAAASPGRVPRAGRPAFARGGFTMR